MSHVDLAPRQRRLVRVRLAQLIAARAVDRAPRVPTAPRPSNSVRRGRG